MASFGDQVREAREARSWSQEDLAREAGVTQSTIDRIESGETKRSRHAAEVAMVLGIPFQLRAGARTVEFTPERDTPSDGPADSIPIYPAAEGGPGVIIITREPIDFMRKPRALDGVEGGYGVYIVGESMSPEFEPGDTAIVHPRLPALPGATCVFYTNEATDDRASIKRLIGIRQYEWHVKQWNPTKDFDLDRGEWPVCHRVVGREPRR